MTIEEALRLIAGALTLFSLALGVWVSSYFLLFTAFIGVNLLQSAFTHWCPMMTLLKWAGLRQCVSAKELPSRA